MQEEERVKMLDIFSGFLQFLKFDAVCIDNNVFRLHYKASVMVLVMASVLVTSRQYIGDPIDCLVDVSYEQNWGQKIVTILSLNILHYWDAEADRGRGCVECYISIQQ